MVIGKSVRFLGIRSVFGFAGLAFGAVGLGGVFSPAATGLEGPRVPLEIKLTLDKERCRIGESVQAQVTLINRGTAEMTVKDLDHDRQSLEFDLTLEGPQLEEKIGPFRYTKIQNGVYNVRQFRDLTLKPGKELKTTVEIPAIVPGTMNITARYNGVVLDNVLPFSQVSSTKVLKIDGDGDKKLQARITTRVGEIVFRFFPDEAPATIMHFILLARSEYYDGLIFHRVVEDFVVQTGCPQGNGSGGPGFNIPAEITGNRQHLKGSVAMARSDDFDSAGSQFYICLNPQESLDGWYTVFGEVISGMDAVEKIEPHHAIEKARIELE